MKLIPKHGKTTRLPYFICLLLTVMTLSVYGQVKHHDFVDYDDDLYVVENPVVQTGLNLKSAIWAFKTTSIANWHPLTWLSHLLDVQLYGLNAGQHHITSLIIHILNTILLFLTFRRFTGALWRSAFVAALFALHPLHVESVAQIACRKDVLSTFFWMLTTLTYAGYVNKPGKFRYFRVLLFFGMGLMTKPMVVTLPFVLLLLDYWPLTRFHAFKTEIAEDNTRRLKTFLYLVWEKIPLFILAAISSSVTFFVQNKGGAVASLVKYPLSVRVANALVSYTRYIAKTIWPTDMSVIYPHPGMWPLWEVAGAFFLLALITIVVIRAVKNGPYLCVGWLWYIGTLIPVIGLVQVGSQAMADRYTYVPLIGLFIMVSWGVHALLKGWRYHKAALAAMAIAVISILMAVSWIQAGYWQNSFKLFAHTIEVTSNNYAAHNNLGMVLQEMGRPQDAIRHYQEALKINPEHVFAHNNWGNALSAMKKYAEAAEHYAAAVKINPHYAKAHYNLANYFLGDGKINEATNHYLEALRIDPTYKEAYNNLGTASALQGKIDEAISHYREALSTDPAFFESSKNLATIYAMQGNYDEARSILKESIAARPDRWEAYYYIAGTYARQNEIEESVSWLEKAVRGGFRDWDLLKTDKNLESIRVTLYYNELIHNR